MKKAISLFIFLSLFMLQSLRSQVTIGCGELPAKAALLDIKQNMPNKPSTPSEIKNITCADGGLLLPRVNLSNLRSLEPFLELTDPDYNEQKLLSVGLVVYNLINNANLNLVPAIYYWDGRSWNKILYTIY